MDANIPGDEAQDKEFTGDNRTSHRRRVLIVALWFLIITGSLLRLAYPFIKNPLNYPLNSDLARHYWSGTQAATQHNFVNIIDPVAYQLYLTGLFQITHGEPLLVAATAAVVSVVTPFLYYLWMRSCLNDKVAQLTGYAILTWLPGWICYSSYFMQESILLPIIGLSLWLSSRFMRLRTYISCLGCAASLGLCANTKASAMALSCILWLWMCQSLVRSDRRNRALVMVSLGSILIAAISLISPLKAYSRLNVFMLLPQEPFNRAYYESGKEMIKWTVAYRDRLNDDKIKVQEMLFESPSICDPPFRPFFYWKMSRQGLQEGAIDLSGSTPRMSVTPYSISLPERLKYTFENGIYLLLADQYPVDDEYPPSLLNDLASVVRWLWLPIVVTISFLSLKRRRIGPVGAISLSYLFLLLIQQSMVMEGRYRMPWEGMAIVALLESLFYRSRAEN